MILMKYSDWAILVEISVNAHNPHIHVPTHSELKLVFIFNTVLINLLFFFLVVIAEIKKNHDNLFLLFFFAVLNGC